MGEKNKVSGIPWVFSLRHIWCQLLWRFHLITHPQRKNKLYISTFPVANLLHLWCVSLLLYKKIKVSGLYSISGLFPAWTLFTFGLHLASVSQTTWAPKWNTLQSNVSVNATKNAKLKSHVLHLGGGRSEPILWSFLSWVTFWNSTFRSREFYFSTQANNVARADHSSVRKYIYLSIYIHIFFILFLK